MEDSMSDEGTQASTGQDDVDDARLASLGYQPQLRRVLGLFANFSASAPAGRRTSG
jgi:hypothetical protein